MMEKFLGLSSGTEVWRIDVSIYSSGLRTFFERLKNSAVNGGILPLSSILIHFPLNPVDASTFEILNSRNPVKFSRAQATADGSYESLDFQDDRIGAITLVIPTKVSAEYSADSTKVGFVFNGAKDDLIQLILWNIPPELKTPQSLRVKELAFSHASIGVLLSNTANSNLLEIQLTTVATGLSTANVKSLAKLSVPEALRLLASGPTVECGSASPPDGQSDYEKCASNVRKNYPVPPGNINAQNQMIDNECGRP